jgi:hypothetical protein
LLCLCSRTIATIELGFTITFFSMMSTPMQIRAATVKSRLCLRRRPHLAASMALRAEQCLESVSRRPVRRTTSSSVSSNCGCYRYTRSASLFRHGLEAWMRNSNNGGSNNTSIRWFNTTSSCASSWSETISKRDMAELEDRIWTAVGNAVHDPVLHQPLAKLKWLHKRIAVVSESKDASSTTTTTLQLLLRLPSLLHPALAELKRLVTKEAEAQVHAWLMEKKNYSKNLKDVSVNVECIATTPVPMMARLVEDHEDLLTSLGPGLASVAHFVAVYSCKVRFDIKLIGSCVCREDFLLIRSAKSHERSTNLIFTGRRGQVNRRCESGLRIGRTGWSSRTPRFGLVRSFAPNPRATHRPDDSKIATWSRYGIPDPTRKRQTALARICQHAGT